MPPTRERRARSRWVGVTRAVARYAWELLQAGGDGAGWLSAVPEADGRSMRAERGAVCRQA